jgi:hypothetical protein
MEEFLRDLLHRGDQSNAHLLVRGHCVRGMATARHHGPLLLDSLLQGTCSTFRHSCDSISVTFLYHVRL